MILQRIRKDKRFSSRHCAKAVERQRTRTAYFLSHRGAYRARARLLVWSRSNMFPCERKTLMWPGLGTWARPRRRSTDSSADRYAWVQLAFDSRLTSMPRRRETSDTRAYDTSILHTSPDARKSRLHAIHAPLLCCAAARHLAIRTILCRATMKRLRHHVMHPISDTYGVQETTDNMWQKSNSENLLKCIKARIKDSLILHAILICFVEKCICEIISNIHFCNAPILIFSVLFLLIYIIIILK